MRCLLRRTWPGKAEEKRERREMTTPERRKESAEANMMLNGAREEQCNELSFLEPRPVS
jgi:hypothetical protein